MTRSRGGTISAGSGCSTGTADVSDFKTRNRSVGIHEYGGGIICTCLNGVRVGMESDSEDSDPGRGGDDVSGGNVEQEEDLKAWKWRPQQRDGSGMRVSHGPASPAPRGARQLFCVARRCALAPPTPSLSVKREPSSGAACLTCGSRRRCGAERGARAPCE